MRPRRIRRGEPPAWSVLASQHNLLQCGHDEFVVENQDKQGWRDFALLLQCGHDEFVVENEGVDLQGQPLGPASMRPRRIRRGEPFTRGFLTHRSSSFNAATTNSSWRTRD